MYIVGAIIGAQINVHCPNKFYVILGTPPPRYFYSCRRDPLISLNYAVFQFNRKSDAQAAAKHYAEFERKVNQLKASGVTEFDPEVR